MTDKQKCRTTVKKKEISRTENSGRGENRGKGGREGMSVKKQRREIYISKQCTVTIQKNKIDTKMLLRSVFHTARET